MGHYAPHSAIVKMHVINIEAGFAGEVIGLVALLLKAGINSVLFRFDVVFWASSLHVWDHGFILGSFCGDCRDA